MHSPMLTFQTGIFIVRSDIVDPHSLPREGGTHDALPEVSGTFKLEHRCEKRRKKRVVPPGIEPGTSCVLGMRDNQLHHETFLGPQ